MVMPSPGPEGTVKCPACNTSPSGYYIGFSRKGQLVTGQGGIGQRNL
jgi:hypothetical protein